MKVNREELLKELESVTPGLSLKEVIEQSSCFVFKGGEVATYNDEIACQHSSCLDVVGAVCALPLLAILRKLGEESIEIGISKGELLIKGRHRKAGIRMEAEVQLPVDAVESPGKWKKLPDDFVDAVSITQECAGKDETQFSMTCIHLHPEWIEACDNFQAIRYTLATGIAIAVLVRRESLKYIVALGMTDFSETETWMHFRNPAGLILSCRRYVEEYPDLTSVLKVSGEQATLPKGLKEAAEKAAIFSVENLNDNMVTLELKQGKLRITGRGSSGWYSEVKKVGYEGEPMSFTISPVLLAELVQHYNTCEISASRLKVDGGKFIYVTALGEPWEGK